MEHLLAVLERFRGKRIIVLGDCMLDKYIWGEAMRISPEAPVQVIDVQKETYSPGGAANVAMNAAALGAEVFMVGILGNDEARKVLLDSLSQKKISTRGMLIEDEKPTTLKVRIMGKGQQLLRVDYEKRAHAHPKIEEKMMEFFSLMIKDIDAIIISDYAKGVITPTLMRHVMELARIWGKIVIVDPKPQHKALYKGATVITPNHAEACQMASVEIHNGDSIEDIGRQLVGELDSSILLTRGEKGMSLFEKDSKTVSIPTQAREVYDVTGAGDTVVATLALALATGADLKDAALLANHAAGIKVGKVGTSTVTAEEISQSLMRGHKPR